MKIGSTNIRSYRNKTNIIYDYLSEFDIDILCLCETKLSEGVVPLNVPGYSIIRTDRDENGGGVAILFKTSFKCQLLPIPEDVVSPDSKLEIICAKFQCEKNKSFVVSSIYRPKFSLSYADIKSLETVFNFLGGLNLEFYACGDFNIHMEHNTKSEIIRFNRLLSRLNLKEHVNMATRGNAYLDLIISNDIRTLHSQTEVLAQSDHLSTFIVRPLKKVRDNRLKITFRKYRSVNWEQFANDVVYNVQWTNPTLIINDASVTQLTTEFINNHVQLFDLHAPLISTTIKQSKRPKILTDSTKQLKNLRNRLYAQYKKHPNVQTRNRLDITNKYLSRAINSDTKGMIQNEIKLKGLWSVKKRFCNQNNTKVTCDPEALNEYYASISNEPFNICPPVKPQLLSVTNKFVFRPISESDLVFAYKKLKNRLRTLPDTTGLAPFMLERTIRAPNVMSALLKLVNASLSNGSFPENLKTSVITPIPKVPNPKSCCDYRPVSSQPYLSLLIEKCAHVQLTRYFEENNLFYRGQFGFRSGQSCEKAMLALIDCAYREINSGNLCLVVSLDLAKAFDVIIREFLLHKLKWYGIDTKWYESYLSYRCQYVKGDKGNSSVKFTIRGCPQGSVQGPLIFNIYINDLPLVVKHCIVILFADDTQLFIAGKPNQLAKLIRKLESDLGNIVAWMKENGMKLNLSKTQFILLGNCHNLSKVGQVQIEIDGITILSQETLKSLGLTVDSRLTWIDHINRLSRSYHLSARSLYPLRSLLTDNQFIQIFNACVTSKCNYMSLLWGAANQKNCKIIERRIRHSARFIMRKSWQDPISSDIHSILKWFLTHELYLFFLMCLLIKLFMHTNLPIFPTYLNT
jgi:exonuclease III